jgi:hypothetical protein
MLRRWGIKMTHYRIILENSLGCELDAVRVKNEDRIKEVLLKAIDEWVINAGDVIRIVEVLS